MEQKTKNRVGAPNKPAAEKVVRIELWLKAGDVEILGGKEKLRIDLKTACLTKAEKLKLC